MADKKGNSRGTLVVAGALFGGLAAVEVGQHLSHAIEASEQATVIVVALGAVIGGALAFFGTRPKSAPALK